MNDDIDVRINFIQEIQRHPYLYDHNHTLYNHREKIESAWKRIGQLFGEDCGDVKKKWRLIRSSYTRSIKAKSRQGLGLPATKEYYMAPHLRFLDPFLKCRPSNLSEDDDPSEINDDSDSNIVQLALESVKVESIDLDDDDDDPIQEEYDDSKSALMKPINSMDSDADNSSVKKRKYQQEPVKKDLNASEMYLMSLAPYLQDMTERQQLRFQKGVLDLIEKIKYDS